MKFLTGSKLAPLAAVAVIAVAGCGGQGDIRPGDIRTYAVPKEAVSAGLAARAMEAGGLTSAAAPALRLRYEVPQGWSDRGAAGMRLATLTIGDPAEGREVTVIPAAGTLQSNVERWLGQLGGSTDPTVVAQAAERAVADAEKVDVDGTEASVVMLRSTTAAAGDDGEAILGAMIPLDDSAALFVKYKGDAAVALRERENFSRFVASLRWK